MTGHNANQPPCSQHCAGERLASVNVARRSRLKRRGGFEENPLKVGGYRVATGDGDAYITSGSGARKRVVLRLIRR
jgi:hypothetical protein